ncbi:hypothetical protein G9C98_002048 [Cotesia typhae]|uniref:Uncharacterized protein n=1 Tax=Cotesia typhae TaxID=2053667 RepID=A0A8J5QSE5_9HYME|nr:hypothetical protein G9C98_002048 [Cotesia typhae]
MSFFGFGQSAGLEIILNGADTRKTAEIKSEDGKKERHFLYYDGETVSGKVIVSLRKAGKLEHQGVKVEFIGQIELYYDRGNHHEFTSLVKELARPGELTHNTEYTFEFANVEKPFESYTGSNVRLRYFLRVTIVRRLSDLVKELELVVHTLSSYPDMNNPIKMEVGIEDCLHIEFEYNKSKYHLKDVIVGKIYFLLVRIKIKHMEIAIIKRETTGSGPHTFTENETIAKYEIMDGAPVKGESIPIRVFLAGYDLTPTMRDINKKFSVRKSQTASPHLPSHLVSAETGFPQGVAMNGPALASPPSNSDEAADNQDDDDDEEDDSTYDPPAAPIEGMTREEGDGEGEKEINSENQ